jgi:WS/DGAT/MGAT family acyltransferase
MPDRLSRADLMQYAVGRNAAARQVGAVLLLGAGPGGAAAVRRVLADRLSANPALRRRLRWPPPLRGRPYWADDPGFDACAHIAETGCPAPGDERALHDLAAATIVTPLPANRPPWSVTLVTGMADGSTGLIVVMDHVLADGAAGLALLAGLSDQPAAPQSEPAAAGCRADFAGTTHSTGADGPPARQMARDRGVHLLRAAVTELGGIKPPPRLPRTSLNRPTGPRRGIEVVAADLAGVRTFARANGGTVNDVVLAAVAGALRELLAGRGEELPEVCVSVPVSARRESADPRLGNQVGMMPVLVTTDGGLAERVRRVASVTGKEKTRARGASAALLVPVFLLLARVGLLAWFVNRQRLISTFVTNMHGPGQRLAIAGAPVQSIIAIPVTTGNVTVTFGVLSYAGALRITIVSDPARVPDAAALAAAVNQELTMVPMPRQVSPRVGLGGHYPG